MIKERLLNIQQQASSPYISAYVSASAGSGKTRIIIDRILRLILAGYDIDTILCITFTNTAANEMLNRLNQKLLRWFISDDNKIIKELSQLTGTIPNQSQTIHARQLYKNYCNKITQIKIQTLHSFCKNILELAHNNYISEKYINPNTTKINILNMVENEKLITNALHKTIDLLAKKRPKYLNILKENYDYSNLLTVTKDILERPNKVKQFLETMQISYDDIVNDIEEDNDYLDLVYSNTLKEFGISDEQNEHTDLILKSYISQIDCKKFFEISEILMHKNKELAISLSLWLKLDCNKKIIDFCFFRSLFLTKDLTPRVRLFIDANMRKKYPLIDEFLLSEQQKIYELQKKLSNLELASLNGALRVFIMLIQIIYDNLKQKQCYISYNDLIDFTASLMKSSEGLNLLYKLDIKINHILIDEAQDLSQSQWDIITLLISEFSSGSSMHHNDNRTLFVVGDSKQSIYSFHGAVPYTLDNIMKLYEKKFRDAGKIWKNISMNGCFRCAPKIITLINNFIENYSDSNAFTKKNLQKHYSLRNDKQQLGIVEILDIDSHDNNIFSNQSKLNNLSEKDYSFIETSQINKKNIPLFNLNWEVNYTNSGDDTVSKKDNIIALHIVDKIMQKLHHIQPEDIMILFKKRCTLLTALVECLKSYDISIQDLTKNDITNNIYLQDLLVIAKFVINPFDEMNLAILLKGPIFNLSDNDLLSIAYKRTDNLFECLKKVNLEIFKTLEFMISIYKDYMICSEFYRILLMSKNSQIIFQFVQSGCTYVNNLLEDFWNLVEQFEIEQINHCLINFINWFDSGEAAISKKQSQPNEKGVRIMTVHGAKGMEASVVILADAEMSENNPVDNVIWKNDYIPIVGKIENSIMSDVYTRYNIARQEENRRLLYVAITRARDELYVVGKFNYNNHCTLDNKKVKILSQPKAASHHKIKQNWYEIIKSCIE